MLYGWNCRKRIWGRRLAIAALLICLLIPEGSVWAETVRGDLSTRFSSESDIEYEGVTYRLRKRLTTLLIAGTDKREDEAAASMEFRNGGQADFLLLLVLDANRDTIQPIQINRDTMTEITVLNVLGKVSGTRTAQLCLAHGFGDGAEQSCELLVSAVSGSLRDVPIDDYMALSLDGIAAFNDALGGVEVTLEDDFSIYDPEMTKGKTLTLQGAQAEYFVRERYYIGDQSNTARMERQKIYMEAAITQITERIQSDRGFVSELVGGIEPYLVTNMGSGRMLNLFSQAREYEMLPAMSIAGETVISAEGYAEFYPDEEALVQTVLEAWYEAVSG